MIEKIICQILNCNSGSYYPAIIEFNSSENPTSIMCPKYSSKKCSLAKNKDRKCIYDHWQSFD